MLKCASTHIDISFIYKGTRRLKYHPVSRKRTKTVFDKIKLLALISLYYNVTQFLSSKEISTKS